MQGRGYRGRLGGGGVQGNKRRAVLPSGMVIDRTFDEVGRLTSRTEISGAFPSGVTQTTEYDELGNKRVVTGPVVRDADGTAVHQLQSGLR